MGGNRRHSRTHTPDPDRHAPTTSLAVRISLVGIPHNPQKCNPSDIAKSNPPKGAGVATASAVGEDGGCAA